MRRFLCMLFLGAVLLPPAYGEIIRLRNGKELQCEILSCSEEDGLTVKRLDTGGVFRLRWEHLLPADAAAIKLSQGFTDEDAQRVLVQAKRVVLRNGTFEDGIPVESDRPGTYCLQRRGKRYYYRQPEVVEIRSVEVEAPEVYTLEELYRMKLQEKAPETARDYFNLGVYLESVTYYQKALEMYQKVKELDETFKPDVVERKIRLMEGKLTEADATAYLDEAEKCDNILLMHRSQVLAKGTPEEIRSGHPTLEDALVKRIEEADESVGTQFLQW